MKRLNSIIALYRKVGFKNLVNKVCFRVLRPCFNLYYKYFNRAIEKRSYNVKWEIKEIKLPRPNNYDNLKCISDNYLDGKCFILGYGLKSVVNNSGEIDYHYDFFNHKAFDSGRVSQKDYFVNGADIKVPWEIARLKELVYLALLYDYKSDGNEYYPEIISNRIQQFTSLNKIGLGIHWQCPMEVGIRMVNLISTFCLLKKNNKHSVLNDSLPFIYQHYRYILVHDEFNFGLRNNHYLSCLCSSIIGAVFFQDCKRLKQLKSKLLIEFNYQFNDDGSNFESSTSYHRYSLDMICWALYFVDEKIFTKRFEKKLIKSFTFIKNITNDIINTVPLIGDNDSGWFLNIDPELSDDMLNLKFNYNFVFNHFNYGTFSNEFIYMFSKKGKLESGYSKYVFRNIKVSSFSRKKYTFDLYSQHLDEYYYPNFGLLVLKDEKTYISFRTGGQSCGHMHNDALSVEIWINGSCIVRDPGVSVYTSHPEKRNLYRSSFSHFQPTVDSNEQNSLLNGLFSLSNNTSKGLFRGISCYFSYYELNQQPIFRVLSVLNGKLEINDLSLTGQLNDVNLDFINSLYRENYGS